MGIPEQPTYILKYTTLTITAIASPNTRLNARRDLHVTTEEDSSVRKTAKGWREINEEGSDLFIVEVDGVRIYELLFADALDLANTAQENLSQRKSKLQ